MSNDRLDVTLNHRGISLSHIAPRTGVVTWCPLRWARPDCGSGLMDTRPPVSLGSSPSFAAFLATRVPWDSPVDPPTHQHLLALQRPISFAPIAARHYTASDRSDLSLPADSDGLWHLQLAIRAIRS